MTKSFNRESIKNLFIASKIRKRGTELNHLSNIMSIFANEDNSFRGSINA